MNKLKQIEPKFGSQEKAIKLAGLLIEKENKVVVTTNGVFDILHVGHVRYLAEANTLGDFLIVLVNSDESTKRIKGNHRPYIPCRQRMEVIAALEAVDFVTWFDEDTPESILERIKPNIHVKGDDWEGKDIPEAKVVEKNGGEMKFVAVHSKEHLNTNIIAQRIVQKELSRLLKKNTIVDQVSPNDWATGVPFREKCAMIPIPAPLDRYRKIASGALAGTSAEDLPEVVEELADTIYKNRRKVGDKDSKGIL